MADEVGLTGENRITLAVVQRDVQHLSREITAWRDEAKASRAEISQVMHKILDDHEDRLRELERKQGRSIWYDLGAGAVGAVGAVLGAVGLKQ